MSPTLIVIVGMLCISVAACLFIKNSCERKSSTGGDTMIYLLWVAALASQMDNGFNLFDEWLWMFVSRVASVVLFIMAVLSFSNRESVSVSDVSWNLAYACSILVFSAFFLSDKFESDIFANTFSLFCLAASMGIILKNECRYTDGKFMLLGWVLMPAGFILLALSTHLSGTSVLTTICLWVATLLTSLPLATYVCLIILYLVYSFKSWSSDTGTWGD